MTRALPASAHAARRTWTGSWPLPRGPAMSERARRPWWLAAQAAAAVAVVLSLLAMLALVAVQM